MREVINETLDKEGFWVIMKTFSEFKFKFGPEEPKEDEKEPEQAKAEEVAEVSDASDDDASVQGEPQLR